MKKFVVLGACLAICLMTVACSSGVRQGFQGEAYSSSAAFGGSNGGHTPEPIQP